MSGPSRPQQEVALVCPVYREGATIGPFLERLRGAAATFRSAHLTEVVFVDDGSTDGTVEAVREAAQRWTAPRLSLIERSRKDGTVSAQVEGFRAVSTPIAVTMDADGQHPLDTIDRLVAAWRSDVDLVVASRYVAGGGVRWESSRRAVISGGARLMAQGMLRGARRLRDPLSGFFLVRREWVADLVPLPLQYKVLLYVLALHPTARIREVPYEMGRRIGGESKLIQGLGFIPGYFGELITYRRAAVAARRQGLQP